MGKWTTIITASVLRNTKPVLSRPSAHTQQQGSTPATWLSSACTTSTCAIVRSPCSTPTRRTRGESDTEDRCVCRCCIDDYLIGKPQQQLGRQELVRKQPERINLCCPTYATDVLLLGSNSLKQPHVEHAACRETPPSPPPSLTVQPIGSCLLQLKPFMHTSPVHQQPSPLFSC